MITVADAERARLETALHTGPGRRLPQAIQITLEDSGHLHWLQNEAAYRDALRHFYAAYGSLSSEHPVAKPEDRR